jgi:hypothetical protein
VRRSLLDTGPLAALLLDRPAAASLFTPRLIRRETSTGIPAYGGVFEYLRGMPDFARHHAGLRALLRGIPPYFLARSSRAQAPAFGPG